MNQTEQMREALLDSDGENKAVRVFLLHYQNPGVRITAMRNALKRSGFDGCWPEFVKEAIEFTTLTKGGAQAWIRHLFALEQALNHTPDTGDHIGDANKMLELFDQVVSPAILNCIGKIAGEITVRRIWDEVRRAMLKNNGVRHD